MIVNPRSGAGGTGRRWVALEAKLRHALGDLEVERTRGPGDAERIAREGVRAGMERVLVAGGDGTLSEVVTGLLAADLGGYAQLGLLPLGTGSDFARGLGVPRDLDAALAQLASAKPRPLDAARVDYRDASGREATRYMLNVASLGVSGLVVQLVEQAPKALGGRLSFLLGTLRALMRFRCPSVRLGVDGEAVFAGPLVLATAANGRYFGGGMLVAPEARLDDGLLDVVVVPEVGRLALLRKLPTIYSGAHLRDPATQLHRGRVLEADAPPGAVPLEVDGEPLGTLPLRVEILPGAISLVGPAA